MTEIELEPIKDKEITIDYKCLGYKLLGKYAWPLCVKIKFSSGNSVWERIKTIFKAYFIDPWHLIKHVRNFDNRRWYGGRFVNSQEKN